MTRYTNNLLAAANTFPAKDVFFYLGIIVAAAIVVIIVALVVRRAVIGSPQQEGEGAFTLGDIRQLHAEGKLSDEEFESAKRLMIARHKAALIDDDGAEAGEIEGDKNFFDDEPDKDPGRDA